MTADRSPLERLKAFVRSVSPGGCRMLTKGEACQCPLCDLDRLAACLGASQEFPRYLPFTHNGEFRGMVEDPTGQWYRVADVDACLGAKKEPYESQPVQPCLDQPEGSADATSVLRADRRASTPTDEGRDDVCVPKLQGHADAQKLERLQWRHERLRDWLQTALETLDVRDFPESVREFLDADAENAGVLPPSQEKEP